MLCIDWSICALIFFPIFYLNQIISLEPALIESQKSHHLLACMEHPDSTPSYQTSSRHANRSKCSTSHRIAFEPPASKFDYFVDQQPVAAVPVAGHRLCVDCHLQWKDVQDIARAPTERVFHSTPEPPYAAHMPLEHAQHDMSYTQHRHLPPQQHALHELEQNQCLSCARIQNSAPNRTSISRDDRVRPRFDNGTDYAHAENSIQVRSPIPDQYVLTSSIDDDENLCHSGDVSACQVAQGMDIQGIPWEALPFSRENYRATRLRENSHRKSLRVSTSINGLVKEPTRNARLYEFFQSTNRVMCSIVHFQLRNLAWTTSKQDVHVMHGAGIMHWDAATREKTNVLDLSSTNIQVSTIIAKDDLVIAGGFYGEVVVKNLRQGKILENRRITFDENAITNAFDLYDTTMMTSSNDCFIRLFDLGTFQKKSSFRLQSAVNHATRQKGGKMVCAVGDDRYVHVLDGDTGKGIAKLHGHSDFSFATWWHPSGNYFATGSQDMTSRVWDIRQMAQSLCILGAHNSPVRGIRYSSCGRFMAMAEQKDFVQVYDVRDNYNSCQEIDMFGEIGGISFTPHDESLFIAVSDKAYSSLLEFGLQTRRDFYW